VCRPLRSGNGTRSVPTTLSARGRVYFTDLPFATPGWARRRAASGDPQVFQLWQSTVARATTSFNILVGFERFCERRPSFALVLDGSSPKWGNREVSIASRVCASLVPEEVQEVHRNAKSGIRPRNLEIVRGMLR
jgi:hypothetical protein